jgi:hypothetical protein
MAQKASPKRTEKPSKSKVSASSSGNNKFTFGSNKKNKVTTQGDSKNTRVKNKNDKRIKGKR